MTLFTGEWTRKNDSEEGNEMRREDIGEKALSRMMMMTDG